MRGILVALPGGECLRAFSPPSQASDLHNRKRWGVFSKALREIRKREEMPLRSLPLVKDLANLFCAALACSQVDASDRAKDL